MHDYGQIFDDFLNDRFTGFYSQIYPGLIRYAARLSGDKLAYMAEDCVQDAVMSTYARRKSFESHSHWYRYLLTSVRNNVTDMLRKASHGQQYIDHALLSDDVEEDVSLAIIYNDTLSAIYSVVESLPDHYRKVFELSFEKGMTNPDIAEALCVAEVTVRKRKARLIELIRLRLGRDVTENYILAMVSAAAAGAGNVG